MRSFALARALALLVCIASCAKKDEAPPPTIGITTGTPHESAVDFTYASLDARPVTGASLRGRPVVLAFVTTWDLASQAQVDYLVPMANHDGDRVAYVLVALQEPQDRELVEVYAQKLGVTFPVALADRETIAGGGPFGDVHEVPTTVILDRVGRKVWQKSGIAKSDELRQALRGL